MQPLQGLLVVDFSTLLPGPLATLLLAEAGAEVVKVERPGTGDPTRHFLGRPATDSAMFALLNRGKKSVVLDLHAHESPARLEPLIRRADVLVEQFRPGVMERFGLAYWQLSGINPGLIYCSITGYGQTGPRRHRAGHDLNYIGDTGLLALGYGSPLTPVIPPVLAADIAGGAYPAVMNILLALRERSLGGGGRHLDIAMTDNVFSFMAWAIASGHCGAWPGNGDALLSGGSPRYRLYRTRDDGLVAAAPVEDHFWAAFCDTIRLDPTQGDDRADPGGVMTRVAAIIAARTAGEWRSRFAASDCCCSVVATPEEAMDDPHFVARGLFDHKVCYADRLLPALPVPIAACFRARPIGLPAPLVGADTAALIG